MSDTLTFEHYPLKRHKMPSNWLVVSIGQIARSVTSGFPSGAHNVDGKGIPHIRPMNIDREGRFDLTSVKYVEGVPPKLLRKGDVLFNNTNSPELIGKTTAIHVDTKLAYSNHMTRVHLEEGLSPVFVAQQLHFLWMSGYFRHRCKNHVNQASISAEPLADSVPLLLPPAAEQERIADTLSELLSDLDAGVAALEGVRAKLKHYRASVLKAAVEGALTAEWREQNPTTESATDLLTRILAERRRRWEEAQLQKFKDAGKAPPKGWKAKYQEPAAPDTTSLPSLPAGWCWASTEQLAWASGYGTSEKCREINQGLPVLRIPNIIGGNLCLGNLKYAPPEYSEADDELVGVGDLLIVRTNGSRTLIGRGAVVRDKPPQALSFASYLIRVRLVPYQHLLKWVSFLWESSHVRRWIEKRAATSAGQYNISLGVLETLVLPLPPEAEQEQLAESLEAQLSVIDHLEADLETKLKSSQALRQSILRAAFEGKLVPQDPNDEPATELLQRIAAEREALAAAAQAAKGKKPRKRALNS